MKKPIVKRNIITDISCLICGRKITETELFLNKNICFVCKLKNLTNKNTVKIHE